MNEFKGAIWNCIITSMDCQINMSPGYLKKQLDIETNVHYWWRCLFSPRRFSMAQRTTAPLSWFPSEPGGNRRTQRPATPSAAASCPAAAGPKQVDPGSH